MATTAEWQALASAINALKASRNTYTKNGYSQVTAADANAASTDWAVISSGVENLIINDSTGINKKDQTKYKFISGSSLAESDYYKNLSVKYNFLNKKIYISGSNCTSYSACNPNLTCTCNEECTCNYDCLCDYDCTCDNNCTCDYDTQTCGCDSNYCVEAYCPTQGTCYDFACDCEDVEGCSTNCSCQTKCDCNFNCRCETNRDLICDCETNCYSYTSCPSNCSCHNQCTCVFV